MPDSRPNIVVVMVDQLRYDALGFAGNTICRTPNLDRLAGEGTWFDSAYTTSPVCSPARASFLTGLYPHNNGVMINTHIKPAWSRGLSPDIPTFSRILKDSGYAMDYAGKWHVNEDIKPTSFGFDRHLSAKTPYKGYNCAPGTGIEVPFPDKPFLIAGTFTYPKEQYNAWATADVGIGMLRERAKERQPFFLRIDIQEPHFPNVIPEPYASMYDPKSIPPWPNFDETFADKPASHLRKHQEWHLEGKDWAWWQPVVAKYYGDITLIDDCVGRVLDAIRSEGLENNTVVVFTTDHGDAMGSHKHFEKAGTMYEEVFHIPLIVRMPGDIGGKAGRVREFARCLDLMPTFVELAGCSLPKPVDGMSLVPFLKGEKPGVWPDSVYCEHHGEVWGYQSQRLVRTHDWKYVYNPTDLDELYDMKADPFETKNRISDPSCGKALAEMKGRLLGWNDATSDMFQWIWVRSNFPAPIAPYAGAPVAPGKGPVKSGGSR